MSSPEKRRSEVSGLPPGWKREETVRKSGLSAGKTDVVYISPKGEVCHSKPELARILGESFDLASFDFRAGKMMHSSVRKSKRMRGSASDYSRGMRHDVNLVLPIRQTASIFKQPVTVVRNRTDSKTRSDIKHGHQEQPRQLFWEKRMEGVEACDTNGQDMNTLELPSNIQAAGPKLSTPNLLQSIAAALHVSTQPITGQSASKSSLQKNPSVSINTEQPLIQAVTVTDLDIRKQEQRVQDARKNLQCAINPSRA